MIGLLKECENIVMAASEVFPDNVQLVVDDGRALLRGADDDMIHARIRHRIARKRLAVVRIDPRTANAGSVRKAVMGAALALYKSPRHMMHVESGRADCDDDSGVYLIWVCVDDSMTGKDMISFRLELSEVNEYEDLAERWRIAAEAFNKYNANECGGGV